MNRTIRLSAIHALNWYGYKDSIPVQGNVLLAGVMGSGKSVLMDLIQYVLIGDERLTRFNQAATGNPSERSVKGYFLGDLNQDQDGIPQYMRQSVIGYVALEFTWPDGKRVETWGIRNEFSSASENRGHPTPFFVPAALKRSDFLDTQKCPLDYTAFRAFVEGRNGRLYTEGFDAYQRDMAQPVHLNFERHLLRSLLPTAMSFTFLRSFNEFCRKFMLPADRLDVADVTASYRTFLAYERELKELNDQFERLKEIMSLYTHLTSLQREVALRRYLEAQLYYEHTSDLLTAEQQKLFKAEGSFAVEAERLRKLDEEVPELRRKIEGLKSAINATPEGQLYNELNTQKAELQQKITDLKEIGSTVESALATRILNAKAWLSLLRALPVKLNNKAVIDVDVALDAVQVGGVQRAHETLTTLASAASAAAAEVSVATQEQFARLAEIQERMESLGQEIAALRIGRLPFPTRLLDILNTQLPRSRSGPSAQHLRELCEVTDEFWRSAIEVAFTRKFAVVVSPEHYEQAEKIYHGLTAAELGHGAGRESLVNPVKALKMKKAVRAGSLAQKITTSHPVAAAVISHFFGELMCVERREDLSDHEFAILPDGFMLRGAFVERSRFYDNLPFIGRRGLEQQLIWKQKQLQELEIELKQVEPVGKAVTAIVSGHQATFGIGVNLHLDLARTQELPALESKERDLTTRIAGINQAAFDEMANQQHALEKKLAEMEQEQRQLLQSSRKADLDALRESVNKRMVEAKKLKDKFEDLSGKTDISRWHGQLQEMRENVLAEFPVKDVAAAQCGARSHQADKDSAGVWEQLKAKRRELAIVYPKFAELDVEAKDNDVFTRQLAKLEESDIPGYKAKAERERQNWEALFRTQVLEKLHEALREVRDRIFFLNSSLKQHPIGSNRYQVYYWQNPEFKIYHDLIEANDLARPDELFFESAEHRFRDAIQQFFTLLIESPDSVEAERMLDYRQYYDYDMEVVRESGRKTSVDRHSKKFSGGENQSPYFIAILASYLRIYQQHSSRKREASIGLVPIDEAFSKLSGDGIKDCLDAIRAFGLQGFFSMSTGNIPLAFEHCDWLIVVSGEEKLAGARTQIRNIPVSLAAASEEARRVMGSVARGRNVKFVATT